MIGRTYEYIGYQHKAVESVFREWESGKDSTLLVLPTGTGKTVTAGFVIQQALECHGRRALFLAHRDTLIQQAFDTLGHCGLDCSIEQANQNARDLDVTTGIADVVVGSVQSMQGDRLKRWPRDRFGLIITDEAHHALAVSYRRIVDWFQGHWHLGITATPGRGDGRNLGSVFNTLAYEYPCATAIKDGWLVPPRAYRIPITIDLKDIRTTGGDFNLGDLAERIGPKVEALCRAIRDQIADRQTVVFAPDVGSAMAVAQVLRDLGLTAKYVSGSAGKFGMAESEKTAVLDEYRQDLFQVIVSCDLLFEGWDNPQSSCAVILRPTKQRYRYIQMVGRVIRRCPERGKTDCLILDFDWQSDDESRSPCSSVELFDDGSLDAEVLAEAKARVKGGQADPQRAIEEAQGIVKARSLLKIKLTGKTAAYRTVKYDPVGVGKILDVKLKSRYDMDKSGSNPASAAQIEYLRSLGVRYPEGISKWGAAKLITKLKARKEKGLASITQVQTLLSHGVNEAVARNMSLTQASKTINDLRPRQLF